MRKGPASVYRNLLQKCVVFTKFDIFVLLGGTLMGLTAKLILSPDKSDIVDRIGQYFPSAIIQRYCVLPRG